MKKIDSLVFDLGGVVLTDEDAGFLFYNNYLKSKIEVSDEKLAVAWHKLWYMVGEDRIDILTFYDNLQEELVGRHDPELSKRLLEEYRKYTKPLGPFYLLPHLKKVAKIYALTNMTAYGLIFKKEKYNLDKYFDLIVSSSDVKLSKPDPRIYQILIQKTGLAPKESVFIDNSEKNILAADKLGFNTIFYQNESSLDNGLKEFGITI